MIERTERNHADLELVARAEDPRTRQAALEAIYTEYGQKVLRYCAARLNEKRFAPDATQDTFLALAKHLAAGNTVRDNLGGFSSRPPATPRSASDLSVRLRR
jgi:hypothetical protein